jgi:H/ACA ribonucleoprotein complex non-core subunit NAF1
VPAVVATSRNDSIERRTSRRRAATARAMLERALERAPLDVRVAAEAARATGDARRRDASDEANVPEFAFDEARRRDDASSSSAWTTSESDEDDGSTSCESVSARDVPKWLARARDGGDDDDDDEDGEDGDAPPRTRNEIANDDGAVTPVAAIGSDETIEAVGRVVSVVGRTMVVQSGRGDATRERETDLDGVDETLDEESVLCTRDRRGLGAIEEVFGPVSAPLYALRLPEEVTAETGDEVFVVVGRSRRIPNVARLYKKGYDASGKDDEEVVEEEEFSDDEEEAAAKAARKKASGKKRSSGARGGGAKPSPMGGGGMFGMRGLPRPPPPPPSAAMGQMGVGGAPPPPSAAGQPMMYVPVRYDARGRPTIVMPPARGPPPPPPPPPSA